MIFTIGLMTAMLGYSMCLFFGEPVRLKRNLYDHIGLAMMAAGALGVLFSLSTLAWRYLP